MIDVMTKCRVLFLVGLMVAVGGCDSDTPNDCNGCATERCMEIVKKTAVPCINDEDIKTRLELVHKMIIDGTKACFSCCTYQRVFCREMLEGLKK